MKHSVLTSLLSATALVAGSAWMSLDAAQAITFAPPANNTSPRTSTGGASRGSFGFVPPPGSTAPRTATGGASRGSFFVPPQGNNSPRTATGGASRNALFAPPAGNVAPRTATGGASRNALFAPPAGNVAPRTATGGASRNLFSPPPGSAAPRQAAGGASRVGSAATTPMEQQSMKPLVPQSYFGTTLKARPTIMTYVPASDAQEAIFSLKDENGNMVHQMVLPVSGEAGVMAVQLPENAPELEMGRNYQWFVALKLDGQLRPSSPYVDGWVKRIAPTPELAKALAEGDALADATALGKMGVWYDCVATLANLRQSQPNSEKLTKNWSELLSSVGLAEIKAAPLQAVN